MKPDLALKHEFVEFIPEELKQGTLYVSMLYKTGTHLCCCGCGNIIVTPITPTDWKIIFDGKTVSLHPSVGNWSFPCQSHYWIRSSRIEWAPKWSCEQIERARLHDGVAKEEYFSAASAAIVAPIEVNSGAFEQAPKKRGFWQVLRKWFS